MKAEIQILTDLAIHLKETFAHNREMVSYYEGQLDVLRVLKKVDEVNIEHNLTQMHLEYKNRVKSVIENFKSIIETYEEIQEVKKSVFAEIDCAIKTLK